MPSKDELGHLGIALNTEIKYPNNLHFETNRWKKERQGKAETKQGEKW